MFTLQNINRFSELNGIKVIHLREGVTNRISFEPVQIASVARSVVVLEMTGPWKTVNRKGRKDNLMGSQYTR